MNNLNELQKRINYQFNNEQLLQEALTHTSYANENHLPFNYERLEFLGDGILQAISSKYLFDLHPTKREGELSKIRAAIVKEKALCQIARQLDVGKYLYLGRGELKTGGNDKESILADVMESLIGAMFLNCKDIEIVNEFVVNKVLSELQPIDTDYKSQLQAKLSSKADKLEYRLVSTSGADHEPLFTIQVVIDGVIRGTGTGRTKKEAEMMAAKESLKQMK